MDMIDYFNFWSLELRKVLGICSIVFNFKKLKSVIILVNVNSTNSVFSLI